MEFEVRFKDQIRLTGIAECIKVARSKNRLEIYPVNDSPLFFDLKSIKFVEESTLPGKGWKKVY